MESRARRKVAAPDRLGTLLNVDEALAGLEDEIMQESQEEEDQEEEKAAVGRAAKSARRGSRPAASPAFITAGAFSDLLAAAPRLVDLLLDEDQVRCITLIARDACNLSLAAGGKVGLAPVWSALATRIKNKAAIKNAAATAAAVAAAAAAAAAEEQQAPGEQQAEQQQQQQAAQAEPGPEPAGRKKRRGRRPPRPPPPPSDLEIVKAAVAADPARTTELRKTHAQWQYRLGAKDLREAVTHRSRCIMISELSVRAAAHRKYGDWSLLEAAKQRAQQVQEQRALTWEKRLEVEREARQEELALRVAEAGLPASFAIRPLSHGSTGRHYDLHYWLLHGARWGGGELGEMLGPIITAHREKSARDERERVLNESLSAEGMHFFRRDWRYRTFLASGLVEELPALLAVARRQAEALRVGLERARELDERLESAGLPRGTTSPVIKRWLDTGEGHIGAEVASLRARLDRELELQEHLAANEILYYQNHDSCLSYLRGESPEGTRAIDVVRALLDGLGDEYDRAEELFNRLVEERLPPSILNHWACMAYVRKGGNLDHSVRETRSALYRRACVPEPPVPRQPGAPDESVDGAAMEEGPAA